MNNQSIAFNEILKKLFLFKVIPLLSFSGSLSQTFLIQNILVPFICTLFLKQFCASSALSLSHSPVN